MPIVRGKCGAHIGRTEYSGTEVRLKSPDLSGEAARHGLVEKKPGPSLDLVLA
jgi:hypothetical protein